MKKKRADQFINLTDDFVKKNSFDGIWGLKKDGFL